jgi:DNA replication protein DnaC
MAQTAEKFCGRWFVNNTDRSLLVLCGESGCGKTHTAKAIFRFAQLASLKAYETGKWELGRVPTSFFVSWPEATDGFKSGEYGAMEDMMKDDLIVLDDLGAEHDPSKNAVNKLCQVLSRRERKFTVVTTNIKPEEWSDRFDVRIADRLLRNSQVINLFAVDSYAML